MSAPRTLTITLDGQAILLRAPRSFTVCQEISNLTATNLHRGAAAALGVCWVDPAKPARDLSRKERRAAAQAKKKAQHQAAEEQILQRPPVHYAPFANQPAVFGQRFLDALMEQAIEFDIPYEDIFAAGMKAYRLIVRQLPGGDEYFEEAEGNFSDGMSEE